MKIDIEIFHSNSWHTCASVEISEAEATLGYRAPSRFAYLAEYIIDQPDKEDFRAVSVNLPTNFDIKQQPHWPAFLLDLLPSGAGRRAIFNYYQQKDRGHLSDFYLLNHGGGNPPGNCRIKQAAEKFSHGNHPGFTQAEIIERADEFIEYAASRGAPVSGSTGIQGDAPKFLLTQDKQQRWHADGALADNKAAKHFIVKFPRGNTETDRMVLRNEAAYYHVAKAMGLRTHASPEFIQNTLFIPRFDRVVENDQVIRFGQESLCSAAGVADFGQPIALQDLCEAFMPHVTDPKTELVEFLCRDILNLALGNTDNHARNIALSKYPNGKITLSPVFDFAPMVLDSAGIARVCRWRDYDRGSRPDWKNVIHQLSKMFSTYGVSSMELTTTLLQFAKQMQNLPKIMQNAHVDIELIKQLDKRITEVRSTVEELGK